MQKRNCSGVHMTFSIDGPTGRELWRRADRVLPGGKVYLSRSARMAGEGVLPGFIRSAKGCRITDVDGREYIDFLCGNGPNLLGYGHDEVDAAAAEQASLADLTSFYPEAMVAYSESLLRWFDDFDWVVHGKNGSDVVSLATRVMRKASGRPLLVLFDSAYHGFSPELATRHEGVPAAALDNTLRLPWNDTVALEQAFSTYGSQIAGVLVNPLEQASGGPVLAMDESFARQLNAVCIASGALLGLDDVRHGFRLHAHGSHRLMGLRPDLICLGKGIANGYATSALLGRESLRAACSEIHFTATYMFSPVAYRAAEKTLEIYGRDQVLDHLRIVGQQLVDGIRTCAAAQGHKISMIGPATMPSLRFEGPDAQWRAQVFANESAKRGAIFHPLLNWFISAAHSEDDIAQAVDIADSAFQATPRSP